MRTVNLIWNGEALAVRITCWSLMQASMWYRAIYGTEPDLANLSLDYMMLILASAIADAKETVVTDVQAWAKACLSKLDVADLPAIAESLSTSLSGGEKVSDGSKKVSRRGSGGAR